MHGESYIRPNIFPDYIGWHQQQIVVVYPDHFFFLSDFSDDTRELRINQLILLPVFLFPKILKVIKTLEVMKEWP